jgi:6-phosphogluconate dehydrogenase
MMQCGGWQQRVGFVGLGNMGAHMASNLLKAGHHLTVHDKYNHFSFSSIINLPLFATCWLSSSYSKHCTWTELVQSKCKKQYLLLILKYEFVVLLIQSSF